MGLPTDLRRLIDNGVIEICHDTNEVIVHDAHAILSFAKIIALAEYVSEP